MPALGPGMRCFSTDLLNYFFCVGRLVGLVVLLDSIGLLGFHVGACMAGAGEVLADIFTGLFVGACPAHFRQGGILDLAVAELACLHL